MEKQQEKTKSIIKYRAFYFSLNIIDLLELLPKNYVYEVLGKQLLRASTSIGANVIEAQAGSSKKDFTNYYHIALKSANETKYWLAILREKIIDDITKNKVNELLVESNELSKMLGSSILTLKGKR
ncbi:MAG: four helix bundle protein [Candidatus Falkowbacteria bacterium]